MDAQLIESSHSHLSEGSSVSGAPQIQRGRGHGRAAAAAVSPVYGSKRESSSRYVKARVGSPLSIAATSNVSPRAAIATR